MKNLLLKNLTNSGNKKTFAKNYKGFKSCRGRARTFTRQLAIAQSFSGRPWSLRYYYQNGSMLCLSCDPHPRDKRACLPKISSPHNI